MLENRQRWQRARIVSDLSRLATEIESWQKMTTIAIEADVSDYSYMSLLERREWLDHRWHEVVKLRDLFRYPIPALEVLDARKEAS
jgi:hypothetical protein